MTVDLAAVIAEHLQNAHNYRGSGRQFIEGQNNANPWGLEQGVANASYCNSAADMVPYHHGFRHWPESQFGEKGCAYTVYKVQIGEKHGEVRFELPGNPCDVEPGDELFYAWSGAKGSASIVDHVETAIERRVGAGRTHNVGYNTGAPGGCYDQWRDGKYLVCRLRFTRNGGYSHGDTPSPTPTRKDDDMLLLQDADDNKVWLVTGGKRFYVHSQHDLDVISAQLGHGQGPKVGHDLILLFPEGGK